MSNNNCFMSQQQQTTINNGYNIAAPKELILELIENSNDITINWFNFNEGDIFYSNDCNEFEVLSIDHILKEVVLVEVV